MRPLAITGQRVAPLAAWSMAVTPPDACATPAEAAALTGWIRAGVPGTAAQALRVANRPFDDLHGQDVWWRTTLAGAGPRTLRFDGLATLCEVWLDDRLLFRSESMFAPREVDVELAGDETLWLACRALSPRLAAKGPRARWRTRITPRQGLRHVRTTLAGQMPGWQPAVDAVGPWREAAMVAHGPVRLDRVDVRATWTGAGGKLSVRIPPPALGGRAEVACAHGWAHLEPQADGSLAAELDLPGVSPWFPRGYGEQPLYPLSISTDAAEVSLGQVGFRSVEVDRGADGRGFGLVVNGAPVFARGACWTGADLVSLASSRTAVTSRLRLAAEAGMNLLRVPGVVPYEAEAFFQVCDELGLMVWQDFAFANFDYPADDPAFADLVREEARAFLRRTQTHPSLAVLCGGSEIAQQAAMMGLTEASRGSKLAEEVLAQVAAELRPDLPYVAHSPGGGDLPFVVDEGVGHYYGVGAYRLPLADARRANVRFTTECLAFANVPYGDLPPPGSEAWKAGVPRDTGADWDFDDVRDHYLRELYGEDASELAARDPALFLDLSRAVSAQVMEAAVAEWRRPGSPTRGALVWTLGDVVPGAGWGVLDAEGAPKAAWYGLKRAFRPVKLTITDEGVNGLKLHLANDTPEPVEAQLSLAALIEGGRPIAPCARAVRLAPRSAETICAFALLGAFFDYGYVYRFGPPGHDAVVARLTASDGTVLDEALHLPRGRRLPRPGAAVTAALAQDAEGWTLTLETDRLVETAWIRDPAFRADDDGMFLAPGAPKRLRLVPRAAHAHGPPRGVVAASGGEVLARFG